MKLSEFKTKLGLSELVQFKLPNGKMVPAHFHITEVGEITKKFIDCGGTLREEKKINFQLWEDEDFDHRLTSQKLNQIIELAQTRLFLGDHEVEVEYQSETIGKFALDFNLDTFELKNTKTACLALDQCGIQKQKVKLSEIEQTTSSCDPTSGCC